MEIQVHTKSLPHAAALRRYAIVRLNAALRCFSALVERVSVQLSDINGPDRGGADKLCRTVIRFRNSALLAIEELGSDMRQVIDRAVERVKQSVADRATDPLA